MEQKNNQTDTVPAMKKRFLGWPKRINLVILFFMGMQTTAGNIAGIIVPVIVGVIIALSNRWDIVFYSAAGILLFGMVMWDIFATGSQVLD